MNKRPKDPAPINPLVQVETSILARQHRGDKKRRDFAERDLQTVGAGETTVDFSIDIKNSVPLGHFADLFHIESLRPRSVKEENSETDGRHRSEQGDLPAVAEQASYTFPSGSETSKEFHR